jgi:hypothetical protein
VQRSRNQVKHLLRRASDDRQFDDRQRDRPRPPGLLIADHDSSEDEHPGDDRRDTVEDVERKADRTGDLRWRELGRVDRGQDPDWDGDQSCQADQDRAAGDRVRDPTARLPEGRRLLGEEVEVDRGTEVRDLAAAEKLAGPGVGYLPAAFCTNA